MDLSTCFKMLLFYWHSVIGYLFMPVFVLEKLVFNMHRNLYFAQFAVVIFPFIFLWCFHIVDSLLHFCFDWIFLEIGFYYFNPRKDFNWVLIVVVIWVFEVIFNWRLVFVIWFLWIFWLVVILVQMGFIRMKRDFVIFIFLIIFCFEEWNYFVWVGKMVTVFGG